MGLLGSGILSSALGGLGGGGFLSAGVAQERQSFSEETRRLLAQYEILKTQSLTLIETVKRLKQELRRLVEKVEVLRGEQQELIHKGKKSSEALEKARLSLGILRREHEAVLSRVEKLERARLKALTQKAQELKRSLQDSNP